jgi:sulfonate transport system ATP-binding protein
MPEMGSSRSGAPSPAVPNPAVPRSGVALAVREVVRGFGPRQVLHGVDFEARPGEFVAIVGRSGSGKTTLLRLLAGLDTPSAGRVSVDGAPPAGGTARVRMVFQEPRLLPWKRVLDNVTLFQPGAPRAGRAEALRALERVGLAGRERDWPAVLSGGEKQRLALARALGSRPGLMLLDEPLGALDAFTRLDMQQLLERLWLESGFTAVLVTHDVQEAVALADRVVSLDAGRVATNDSIDLPRPRDRQSTLFNAYVAAILARLGAVSAPASPDAVRANPTESGASSSAPPQAPYRGWVQT